MILKEKQIMYLLLNINFIKNFFLKCFFPRKFFPILFLISFCFFNFHINIAWATDISYGSVVDFNASVATYWTVNAEIGTDKFVTCYLDTTGVDGTCNVSTVSATTIAAYGTDADFNTNIWPSSFDIGLDVCKIDDDKFVVVYVSVGDGDDGYARAGSVSGTTISYGTAVEVENDDLEWLSCATVSTDKFVMCYNNETDASGDTGFCTAATVSGTTISMGSPVNLFAGRSNYPKYMSTAKVNTDKFVTCFMYEDDANDSGFCKAGTVSAKTITMGAIKEFNSNEQSNYIAVTGMGTDRFVVVYNDATDDTALEAVAATVSATTITYGTEVIANSAQSAPNSVIQIDADTFVAAFSDSGGAWQGKTIFCEVTDWSTRAVDCVTSGTEETFHASTTGGLADLGMDIELVSTNKVVVVYQDDADADEGQSIAGYTPTKISGTSSDFSDSEPVKAAVGTTAQSRQGTLGIAGAWDIYVQHLSSGDKVVLWVDGQLPINESTAFFKAGSDSGDGVTGVILDKHQLSVMGVGAGTINSTTDFALYDCTDDEDIMFKYTSATDRVDVDGDAIYTDEKLFIDDNVFQINNGDILVTEDLEIDDVIVTMDDATLTVNGTWTNNTGSTFMYVGDNATTNSTHTILVNTTYYDLEIDEQAGDVDTFTLGGALDVNNRFVIWDANVFDADGQDLNIGEDMYLAGAATRTLTGGTFTFDGTAVQSLYLNTDTYTNLVITNNTAVVTIYDGFSTTNFTSSAASVDIEFDDGITGNISGTLTLDGADGSPTTLTTMDGTGALTLNVTGGVQDVSYLTVSWSAASGNDILCKGCTNGGNNDDDEASPHWRFGPLKGAIMVH